MPRGKTLAGQAWWRRMFGEDPISSADSMARVKDSLAIEKSKLSIKDLQTRMDARGKLDVVKPSATDLQHAAIDSLVKLGEMTPVEGLGLKGKVPKKPSEIDKLLGQRKRIESKIGSLDKKLIRMKGDAYLDTFGEPDSLELVKLLRKVRFHEAQRDSIDERLHLLTQPTAESREIPWVESSGLPSGKKYPFRTSPRR